MNYRAIANAIALLVGLQSIFMLPSLGWSLHYNDGQWLAWVYSILMVGVIGAVLAWIGRGGGSDVLQREAVAITGLGWIIAAASGAIPFMLTGTFETFTDAYFETMSGFTTTGSTVLTEIESVAPSVLFWRSMTHWLGGIGIIVIFIAILPVFSTARKRLYQSEIPGVSAEGLTPRIKQTAVALLKIYLLLSAAETLLLWGFGHGPMTLFDALCHTFGTVATGGFSTKNASIGYYNSVYVESVIIVFMFLAGCNFTLHYFFLMRRRWTAHLHDVEFRFYAGVLFAVAVVLGLSNWLMQADQSIEHSLRDSAFTVVSIMTTTGYTTADFELWPNMSRGALVLLMFIGGCGGSTGGGMKVIRFVVLFRHLFNQVERHHSPRAIRPVKLGGRILDEALQFNVLSHFFVVSVIAGVGTILLESFEPTLDLVSAFTAVAATLNNIGPGLGAVGAIENYAFLSDATKWLLSLCMVMGRLEIFAILVLLAPRFWRHA